MELNNKYLKEINEKNQYINSLEQNLAKVQEERDSLYTAKNHFLILRKKYL